MSTSPTVDPVPPLPPLPVSERPYDAILIVGFGGPEGSDDVIPFLENVLRGRNVPRERMLEVAEHYYHFNGVSPINGQVLDLIEHLRPALTQVGVSLPVYWGNRNWHPMLTDTLRQMIGDGVQRALAVVLSTYSSYSGCRQYREDLLRAKQTLIAEGLPESALPRIDKMRVWYNHPGWIAANAECLRAAFEQIPSDRREKTHLAFTAHSIPNSMAKNCNYEAQLTETCRLLAEELTVDHDRWALVYQSRSGRPEDPWLEPDIVDHLRELARLGVSDVVVHPVGFLSDHMEVLYDLDEEARHACAEIGLNMVRAATVGSSPTFVNALADLILERTTDRPDRPAVGRFPANHDICPLNCCLPPARPQRPAS